MNSTSSRHELTDNNNGISDVGSGDSKINKTANQSPIAGHIRKRFPVVWAKLLIQFNRSNSNTGIRESSPRDNISSILLLREKDTTYRRATCARDL